MDKNITLGDMIKGALEDAFNQATANESLATEAFEDCGPQRLIISLEKDGIHLDMPRERRVLPLMVNELTSDLQKHIALDSHVDTDLQMIFTDYVSGRIDERYEKIMKEK